MKKFTNSSKCKYGVKCCDINCKLIHPSPRQGVELCDIENCINIACQKLHPFDEKKRYCEFADECQRIICPYVHPGFWQCQSCCAGNPTKLWQCRNCGFITTPTSNDEMCEWGVKCYNVLCKFRHPEPRESAVLCNAECTDINCNKIHILNEAECPFADKCNRILCPMMHPQYWKCQKCKAGNPNSCEVCRNCKEPKLVNYCIYGTKCTNLKCKFVHPSVRQNAEVCPYRNCRDKKCQKIHTNASPLTECKFSEECERILCTLKHPKFWQCETCYCGNPYRLSMCRACGDRRPATCPTPAKCRYGVRCNNFYCNFQHPVPRQGAELCSDNCEDKKCQKFHLYKNNTTGNCKFQDNCERPLCSLKHPNFWQCSECHMGNIKTANVCKLCHTPKNATIPSSSPKVTISNITTITTTTTTKNIPPTSPVKSASFYAAAVSGLNSNKNKPTVDTKPIPLTYALSLNVQKSPIIASSIFNNNNNNNNNKTITNNTTATATTTNTISLMSNSNPLQPNSSPINFNIQPIQPPKSINNNNINNNININNNSNINNNNRNGFFQWRPLNIPPPPGFDQPNNLDAPPGFGI